MSSKALDINSFLTPSTCFSLACLAFSLVAISTAWRNMRNPSIEAKTEQRRPGYDPHASANHTEERQQALIAVHEQQSRLASVAALSARIIQQLHSERALTQGEKDLISELSLLTFSLCRLQQDLFASPTRNLVDISHGTLCFDSAMCSLQAVLASLAAKLSRGDRNFVALSTAVQQLKHQKPLLDVLLTGMHSGKVSRTSVMGSTSTATFGNGAELDIGMPAVLDGLSGNLPGVHRKPWDEPPPAYSPAYSPPAASTSVFSEKQKTDARAPVMDTTSTANFRDCEALYEAVTKNDSKAVTDLLASGAERSAQFGDLQRTPLHQAAHLNHCDCLSVLLRYGAEMAIEDVKGDTALHLAAWAGNVEAVAALLAHGADVDWISGRDGYSPLWCAVSAFQIDAARWLLKTGARVSLRSVSGAGLTALHQAAVTNQGAMCELLVERGAQVDATDDDKSTPLHYSSASGCVLSTMALLDGGANCEARQIDGLTPVHWAAHKGHVDVLALLLGRGGQLDCKTDSGATPLHLAANRGHSNVTRLLIERGASIEAWANWDGIVGTPANMATARGHGRLAKIFACQISNK